MKPLVAAVAVLVALAVGSQAQTPELDALRARVEQGDATALRALAEQGDAFSQTTLGVMNRLANTPISLLILVASSTQQSDALGAKQLDREVSRILQFGQRTYMAIRYRVHVPLVRRHLDEPRYRLLFAQAQRKRHSLALL